MGSVSRFWGSAAGSLQGGGAKEQWWMKNPWEKNNFSFSFSDEENLSEQPSLHRISFIEVIHIVFYLCMLECLVLHLRRACINSTRTTTSTQCFSKLAANCSLQPLKTANSERFRKRNCSHCNLFLYFEQVQGLVYLKMQENCVEFRF